MFIITGNNIQEEQVRILDTKDMIEEWYSYDLLKRGIKQGLDIKGLDTNNNIICQQPSISQELSSKYDFIIAKYAALRNKNIILNVLQPYGFIDTEDDIDIDDTSGVAIRLRKLNKVITKDIEESLLGVDPNIYQANSLYRNIAIELLKLPIFNQDGLYAYLTHIINTDIENTYLILLDNITMEITLTEYTEAAVKQACMNTTELNHEYYLKQLLRDKNKDFSRKYFISDFIYHDDISSEALLYERDIYADDIVFGSLITEVVDENTIRANDKLITLQDIIKYKIEEEYLDKDEAEEEAEELWIELTQNKLQRFSCTLAGL